MIYEVDAPMYAPLHPGEFITETYLAEWELSAEDLAIALDVMPLVVRRILTAESPVTPEMALRLSKALGRSAESWLAMQQAYDLWHARQTVNLDNVRRIDRPAAWHAALYVHRPAQIPAWLISSRFARSMTGWWRLAQ